MAQLFSLGRTRLYAFMKTTLLIVVSCAAILASGCATPHSHCRALEYKVMAGNYYAKDMEKKLNDLAGEGWRLDSVSTSEGETPMALPYSYIILKREKR